MLHALRKRGQFSPRTRGCSFENLTGLHRVIVFPAHAGMFRSAPPKPSSSPGFPRARGDVPGPSGAIGWVSMFSPRTRGCSHLCKCGNTFAFVFPAHAGMFLASPTGQRNQATFSPRTRGCSGLTLSTINFKPVFPAHAGMFL